MQSHVEKAVEAVLKSLDPPMMGVHERLSILKDDETGVFIYRSVSTETGEVLRQWPAEAMLQYRQYLRHSEGLILDREV